MPGPLSYPHVSSVTRDQALDRAIVTHELVRPKCRAGRADANLKNVVCDLSRTRPPSVNQSVRFAMALPATQSDWLLTGRSAPGIYRTLARAGCLMPEAGRRVIAR